MILTEGCRYVAESTNSYWFFDIILSYQHNEVFRKNTFQVWTLFKVDEDSWKVECTDGNCNSLCSQTITYSHFPLDDFKIFLVKNIAMLPTEY
jgi:hypothetical protein